MHVGLPAFGVEMTDLLCHVEIIPAQPAHWPWILATFRRQAAEIPGSSERQAQVAADALARILRGGLGHAACVVPLGFHDDLMAWGAECSGALLFTYVRREFRRQGLGAALVARLFPTLAGRLPVAFWTDDAAQAAAHGFPIEYSIHAFRALCRYSPRGPRHNNQARATT